MPKYDVQYCHKSNYEWLLGIQADSILEAEMKADELLRDIYGDGLTIDFEDKPDWEPWEVLEVKEQT